MDHTLYVTLAWAGGVGALALLVLASVIASRRARAALDAKERRP